MRVKLVLSATLLALSLTACSSDDPGEKKGGTTIEKAPTPNSSGPAVVEGEVTEAQAKKAAQQTLTNFFNVKLKKNDPFAKKVKEQYVYLVGPEVHPSTNYMDLKDPTPFGIEETKVDLELTNVRYNDGSVAIDFSSVTHGTGYDLVDGQVEGDGEPTWSRWEGSAVLIQKEGKFLIDQFSITTADGGAGDGPEDK